MNALDQSMSKEDQYFSMGSIVDMCCTDLDLSVNHFFQKFLSWGMWGLVQLKMDTANRVQPVILPVTDVLTVTLPPDCVDVVKVALIYGQYVKELSRSDDLSKLDRTTATFNPSKTIPPSWLPNGSDFQVYNGFMFGNHGGRALLSVGGGGLPQRGHYTIIQRGSCKEILLDIGIVDCTKEVYVEFIGLGINSCDGNTIVGPYLAEYVRRYIHHQFAKFGKRADRTEAEIVRTGKELWDAEMIVRGRVNAINPVDIQRASRANYRLTNKI